MDRNEFLKKLYIIANVCEHELKKDVAEVYAELLEPFGWHRIEPIMNKFLLEAKINKFPVPADFMEILNPPLQDSDEGIEVANRIISAIGKYGYTNPEQAKEFMGDIAWAVVESWGGWQHICENFRCDDEGINRAQLRETAKTMIRRERQGRRQLPPMFAEVVGVLSDRFDMNKKLLKKENKK